MKKPSAAFGRAVAATVLLAPFAVATVQAQTTPTSLDKLKQMKVSGSDPNIPLLPQTGKNADSCART